MRCRIIPAALTGLSLCAPGALAAQTSSVVASITFVVPVNLTQLSPDLEKVRLACVIASSPVFVIPTGYGPSPNAEDEMPVMNGQVVTTLRAVIFIQSSWLQDPIGKDADYGCALEGFSKSLARWDRFADNAPDPVFRLKPTPQSIWGKFVW